MKRSLLLCFALVTYFIHSSAVAQDNNKLTYYVGIGPAIDGNIGLYGINISNELSFGVGKRTSLNPSLTYYQSIKSFDNFDDPKFGQDNSSGLFTNVTFKYDVLKTKNDFKISLAFGPSFQIGSENGYGGSYLIYDDVENYYVHQYTVERFFRLGYTQQIAFDWKSKNENRRNSAVVSMSSFDGYWPWYLMATYRIGYRLR
ncbi:hypothetical protein LZF95_00880 [Algoriphagus sp. AGSA1]|uniref:hypothetical protein n=1 Tax=Algoriphagus sp. AGSA1 TaxID=2907213 RepID=UPI001F20F471|nr:hypothetical protein [Algoriphagus sp. AGSA1]MCE7053208.1 hypothetical protein [Algoriphagus sp. AGSA1]